MDVEKESSLLSELLRSVAQREGMTFFDRSADAKREAAQIADLVSDPESLSGPVVVMSLRGEGRLGLGASNGTRRNEMVVGFSSGDHQVEASLFAEDVIRLLREHWDVKIVPDGQGAMPMTECAAPE